jgi:PAS domain S-box-containing protein
MKMDRNSLWFKIALPGFFIVIAVFAIMLLAIGRIAHVVQEDYSRFIVTAAGMEAQKILSSKASELTAAKLMENSVVVEAMQESTAEALSLLWSRTAHQGIIVKANGAVLSSTLPSSETRAILDKCVNGYFTIPLKDAHYYCYLETYPLWGWKVITVIRTTQSLMTRSGINLLAPIIAFGCLLMGGGLLLVLSRRINHPIALMVSAISKGDTVKPTGVSELDFIGSEVNLALQRLGEKTAALENELQERLKTDEALRAKDEHIRLLLNSTAEGIYGVDLSGCCTFCNPSCLQILGYDDEEQLLGKNIHKLIHHTYADGTPYPAQKCKAYSAHCEAKMVYEANEVFWRPDGSSFAVEYWAHPIIKGGEITGSVVTFIDISDRRLLEEKLLQTQKIESIGRLAGGVAHDFNNLLTPIIGYAEMLKNNIPGDAATLTKIDYILKAADKARVLVQQLLSFSRKQILNMKVIDLNLLITSFHEILSRTIRENIELRLHLSAGHYGIRADIHQLEQVLMNLVVNARDAISGNGIITIETAPAILDDDYCRQHEDAIPGRFLMLSVSDTGSGIDKHTLKQVFEPFFTTKGVGEGTGLGLSTVYGLVKQHGGSIWVHSEPGKGSTFNCYFPIVEELPLVGQPSMARPITLSGANRTILLVEDNDMARDMARELLEEYGFTVISADCPQAALTMIAGAAVDLLITDVVMPGMTGPQLHERLIQSYPRLKTLYMSGYTNNVIVHHGVPDQETCFIQKPFTIDEFTAKVEAALNS